MKNLANCSPREFLVQTNKIRKRVQDWLTLTGIMDIRKRMPVIPVDASIEERHKAMEEQSRKNMSAIMDAIMDEHPEESAELLGLMCFIEPEDLDNYKMSDIFGAFNELLNCSEVVGFFSSLMQLVMNNFSST